MEFPSCAEAGLFGRRTAEEQELMRGVHELQLLLSRKNGANKKEVKLEHKHIEIRSTYPARGELDNVRPVAGYNPENTDNITDRYAFF